MINHIDDNNFQNEVLTEKGVVVVDFYATWCAPCKMLAPVLEELNDQMNEVKFVKIDVDKSPVISNQYKVQSIPTVLIFKDGKIQDKKVGFVPKDNLKDSIEEAL